ncbi:MAG: Ycf51 family protein [Geminocystis sp.]|nr:Ycf51 family protein [Geminocystis sp.]HIK37312.1 Ycf51 family protein [Geminocystis sp. M7585_C2015_104]MCS7148267.1 Ycf51 family protein [Geminocystis sp.]MCX8077682.1 Ycf51 family protein [Geminocystis sp.]MDW8116574.1 Ycf51 family protein [Geminocystis sp.]
MEFSLDFAQYSLWCFYGTISVLFLTLLAFIFKWGFRFRLVGVTAFMAVLTGGLFALSLGLFQRVEIPNAAKYSLVYDNGATQAVIAVSTDITPPVLEATLKQAAMDLFSYGRMAIDGEDSLTIRARVQVHQDKKTIPIYLGQIRRSLAKREDPNAEITIFQDAFAKLESLLSEG